VDLTLVGDEVIVGWGNLAAVPGLFPFPVYFRKWMSGQAPALATAKDRSTFNNPDALRPASRVISSKRSETSVSS
jgi:hypothetical protein